VLLSVAVVVTVVCEMVGNPSFFCCHPVFKSWVVSGTLINNEVDHAIPGNTNTGSGARIESIGFRGGKQRSNTKLGVMPTDKILVTHLY
jgi:hypothetical protein